MGGPPQRPYLNGVLALWWDGSPRDLLDLCREVESEALRVRRVRWGPRTLDLDILAIDGLRVRQPDLEVPHPRALERAFAVVPLLEVGGARAFGTDRLLAARRATRGQRYRVAGPWPR